jgi:hypothetical protein
MRLIAKLPKQAGCYQHFSAIAGVVKTGVGKNQNRMN